MSPMENNGGRQDNEESKGESFTHDDEIVNINSSNSSSLMPVSEAASTKPKHNHCKASKFLASLAADFDVLTDWVFYFHIQATNVEYFRNDGLYAEYIVPRWTIGLLLGSCVIGTALWLVLATDGAIATPILRSWGFDKLSLGHILLGCVLLEDLPQVILTFFIEDYYGAEKEFSNYAMVNIVASLYDILIKLAEAYDQRAGRMHFAIKEYMKDSNCEVNTKMSLIHSLFILS